MQADFYAGVWAALDNKMFGSIEPGDVENAIDAASKIGDDYLQRKAYGREMPDSFNHGRSEQRVRWLSKGLQTGDPDYGDTFQPRIFRTYDIFQSRHTHDAPRAPAPAAAAAVPTSPIPWWELLSPAPDGRIIGEGWHRRFRRSPRRSQCRGICDRRRPPSLPPEHCLRHSRAVQPLRQNAAMRQDARRMWIPTCRGRCRRSQPKVSGRGIAMLRQAGIHVDEGLLADDSRRLNVAFHTAHTLRRPYVQLKWACSADGFIDADDTPAKAPTASLRL